MSIRGGWARLIKQQQQQQLVADHHEDNSMKYKDINSKQQQNQLQNMNVNSCYINTTTTTTTTSPGTMLQVALHDQGVIKASKILQLVRNWRSQSARQLSAHRCRSSTCTPRSSSCTKLGLIPLSCVTFSSIHLHSDDEDDDEEEQENDDERGFASDRSRKSTPIQRRRGSGRGGNVRAPARALSCPKLGSPLGLCTPFPSIKGREDEDERESVRGNKDEERMKLSPSSSSVSKRPTTPKGYLALYVGEERRRFLVKANLLNHPLFGILLEKAKEEFGFHQQGALNIPCEISFFQHIMLLVESNDPSFKNADHSSLLLPFTSPTLAASVM